jgi:hypothetical protein
VASKVSGELALIRLMVTVRMRPVAGSVASAPNRIFAISIVSRARSGCVTEPMNGLSLYFMWL